MSHAPLAALADALARWDGSLAEAERARQAAQQIVRAAQRSGVAAVARPAGEPRNSVERALRAALSAYERRRPLEVKRLAADADFAHAIGPFLGDPAMGAWPFHDPLLVDDDAAVAWLPVLAAHAPIDGRMRELVTILYRVRRREVWTVASDALARMARRDAATREVVADLWQRRFPRGLPDAWPHGRMLTAREARATADAGDEGAAHASRHAFHLGCAWLAHGGEAALLGGVTAAAIAALPLPSKDPSDASVVLLGLTALAVGEATREAVVPELPTRAREASASPLVEEALRTLADALRAVNGAEVAVAAVERRLREPRFATSRGADRIDTLWSFLATARWFQGAGAADAVAEMRELSGLAGQAFALALDGTLPDCARDAVAALLPRLGVVLDEDVWRTTAGGSLAATLAELLLLLERPEIATMPWDSLVRRACPTTRFVPQEGRVSDVARTDLLLLSSERSFHPRVLLREARFEERVVLHLAACQDGFVARQVAVESERLLREAARRAVAAAARPRPAAESRPPESGAPTERVPGGDLGAPPNASEAQAQFLWKLLQRDPPSATFRELGRALRGSKTRLHRVVETVAALDALRDARRPAPEIAAAYAELAHATGELIQEAHAEAPSVGLVRGVSEALLVASALDERDVGKRPWLDALAAVLLGDRRSSGIYAWMRWLGAPAEGLQEAWSRFQEAAASAHASGVLVSLEQCRELDTATDELRRLLAGMAWPEADIVRQVLRRVRRRTDEWRKQARVRLSESERVTRLLDRGDERALVDLVNRGDRALDLLPPEELRRVARFLLLRLRYGAAARLRALVAARAQLPGPAAHVTPLFLGVSGGTLLVLDVGTAWNDVVLPGHGAGYWATISSALALSFLVLVGSVVSLMPHRPGATRAHRIVEAGLRVTPTFVAALALACGVSALVLVTLQGTPTRLGPGGEPIPFLAQTLLWGSLSLFLGLFFGLILQGRSTFREE